MREAAGIYVFLLRLPPGTRTARSHAAPPGWLDAGDRQRYQSMLSARRRAEFSAGRLLLRHAMALCHPDRRWKLVAPQGQPPRIEASDGGKLASVVSIAHSGGLIACAIADTRRLGVDIEVRGMRKRDPAGLARAALHPLEQAEMAGLPEEARGAYFLRQWTLKEALSKALGEGLSLPFRAFAFAGLRLVAAPERWSGMDERWTFAAPDAGPDAALALAWTTVSEAEVLRVSVREVDQQQLPEIVAM